MVLVLGRIGTYPDVYVCMRVPDLAIYSHHAGNNLRALPRAITELQELEVVAVDGSLLSQLEPTVAEFVNARAMKSGSPEEGP